MTEYKRESDMNDKLATCSMCELQPDYICDDCARNLTLEIEAQAATIERLTAQVKDHHEPGNDLYTEEDDGVISCQVCAVVLRGGLK